MKNNNKYKPNRILVYDDKCPLCAAYTEGFVKSGLLPREGRVPFSTVPESILESIDFEKSKNEIPLYDIETKKMWYGIDALLEILGARFPWIKWMGNRQPIKWTLKKFYKLISYNRKVIVATKCGPGAIDCAPDFSFFYRILFMSIFLLFNTLMLFPIHDSILAPSAIYNRSVEELQVSHLAFVGVNLILASTLERHKAVEYLGQVNMLALITILLMIPLMLVNKWIGSINIVTIIYLALVTLFIIMEYFRRMRFANTLARNKLITGANLISFGAFLFYLFS
jgi:predicted DCC family thiol-disulfide oxidoreductase YuxK